MFDGRAKQTGGVYETKHHLEEMAALFGPFFPQLLAQGDQNLVSRYFDEHGELRDPIPRPKAFLENWIESLGGKDKEEFVQLLKTMMKIDPNDRKAAKQLLDESWVRHASTQS
jgi:serine/threonine-protein kinase SRPK3